MRKNSTEATATVVTTQEENIMENIFVNFEQLSVNVFENLCRMAEKLFRYSMPEMTSIDAQALLEAVEMLPERERKVLTLRYDLTGEQGNGWTLKAIGEVFGVVPESVRQIERKAFRKLNKVIVRRNYDLTLKADISKKEARAKVAIEQGDELVSIDTLRLNQATIKMLRGMQVETVADFKALTKADLDTSYPCYGRRLWEIEKHRLQMGAPLE